MLSFRPRFGCSDRRGRHSAVSRACELSFPFKTNSVRGVAAGGSALPHLGARRSPPRTAQTGCHGGSPRLGPAAMRPRSGPCSSRAWAAVFLYLGCRLSVRPGRRAQVMASLLGLRRGRRGLSVPQVCPWHFSNRLRWRGSLSFPLFPLGNAVCEVLRGLCGRCACWRSCNRWEDFSVEFVLKPTAPSSEAGLRRRISTNAVV